MNRESLARLDLVDERRATQTAGSAAGAESARTKQARLARWTRALGYFTVCLYAAFVAWRLQPDILGDDAAITFRYAERLGTGHGFTYNDHEHVLGASNPLYTLVLSIAPRLGWDIEQFARLLGGALFVTSAFLAARVTARLSTHVWGLVAGLLLVSQPFYSSQMLGGMESGLSVVLGLLVILALIDERNDLAAIALGLALWNKIDAGMLALCVAVAWWTVRKTFPFRLAVISLAVVVPWIAFAWWYFGSPVPNSLTTKLGNNTGLPTDHLWVAEFLWTHGFGFIVLAATLALAAVWGVRAASETLGARALAAWLVLHALSLSVVWLGDRYPWYLTVLCPPPIILGCVAASRLLQWAGARKRALGLAASMAAIVLLYFTSRPPVSETLARVRETPGVPSPAEAFEFDRRLAGLWLAQHADPSEVVSSGFGWVAYELPNPFNDTTRLNSAKNLNPQMYFVQHGVPYDSGFHPPPMRPGYMRVATFNLASDLSAQGYSWFVVLAANDSVIARSGKRYKQLRLFELPPPRSCEVPETLDGIRLDGVDLHVRSPDGATFVVANDHQPVHLVFTTVAVENEGAGRTGCDGEETFDVECGGSVVLSARVRPGESRAPVVLALPGATDSGTLTFSLINRPASADRHEDVWRSVKVVVGDAYVDLARIGDSVLKDEWVRHNPTAMSP